MSEKSVFRTAWRTIAIVVALMYGVAPVSAQVPLLTDGDFESGTFAGWTRMSRGEPGGAFDRDFALSTPGADTPGNPTFASAANPTGGQFYAVSVADAPGESVLLQTFTVPNTAASLALTFQMFVNDQSESRLFGGPFISPSGLDHTTGGTFDNNQHARVDILTAAADPFSTAPDAIVRNLYVGLDSAALPNGYTDYSFDLTPFLTPGQTYQLRFAEVDNLSALNVGVDNVSLIAGGIASAPEPCSGMLAALTCGILGLAAWGRHYARRQL